MHLNSEEIINKYENMGSSGKIDIFFPSSVSCPSLLSAFSYFKS